MTWLGPLLLTVSGGVVYHAAAKMLPKDVNPALVIMGAYTIALCVSAVAFVFIPANATYGSPGRVLHPAVFAFGFGAAMIELGYVFVYRAAWPVSVASLLVNSAVSVLLVVVGMTFFDERVSLTRALGVALCLAGAWLLKP